MIELKKLEIERETLEHLPIMYHFMTYNELMSKEFDERYYFPNSIYNGNQIIHSSEKPISKLIDYSLFKPE